jgi:hypothetical protein
MLHNYLTLEYLFNFSLFATTFIRMIQAGVITSFFFLTFPATFAGGPLIHATLARKRTTL